MRLRPLFFVGLFFFLSSCSSWYAARTRVEQANSSQTKTLLQDARFKNVGRFEGEAKAVYYFYLFGPSQQDLYSQAFADLEKKAGIGGNRVLTGILVDQKVVVGAFHLLRKLTVSGMVVEFSE